jgi:DNA-binding HxlR family transcriptional regulator
MESLIMEEEVFVHSEKDCQNHLGAVDDALYVIGGKWTLRIIVALRRGNRRFNELQRTLGISAKVLSGELKDMEQNGLIKRNIYHDDPVVIEYTQTEYCSTLHEVLTSLNKWGTRHREKIMKE